MTNGDFVRHLSIARGSLLEVETLLLIGIELEYFTADLAATALALIDEISRILAVLIRKLGKPNPKT